MTSSIIKREGIKYIIILIKKKKPITIVQKERKWDLGMRVIKHKRNNPYKLNKFDLVEIDIRKYLGRIYVSHSEGDICIATLDDYLNIAKKKKVGLVAIDMKSKGLEQYAITMLEKYNIPGFVFDLNNYQIDLKYNHTNRVPLMLNEENPFLESFEPKKWIGVTRDTANRS